MIPTIITGAIVLTLSIFGIRKYIRDSKKGGCGCGCDHCPHSGKCH